MSQIAALLKPPRRMPVLLAGGALLLLVGTVLILVLGSAPRPGQMSLDAALEQLEEQVRLNPQDLQARLAVAIGYAARGYDTSAIEQFQEVLKQEPNNQTALIGVGRAYLRQGKLDQAVAPFLQVVELNKDNPVKHSLEQLEAVYYDLGVIYMRQGDNAQAALFLQQALAINRVDADAHFMLGQVQQANGDLEAALYSYRQAVRLAPDFIEAYEVMGGIYKRLGKIGEAKYSAGMIAIASRSYDKAIAALQEAIVVAPDLAEAHQGLAIALESKGRAEDALASYRRALQLDPTLMLSSLAVQRLAGR